MKYLLVAVYILMPLQKYFWPVVITAAIVFFLTGCEEKPHRQAESVTADWYEVVDYSTYLRFRVDLRNVETGELFTDVYVSKECEGLPENFIGSRWEMKTWTYRGDKGLYSEVVGAQCERFRTGAVYLMK